MNGTITIDGEEMDFWHGKAEPPYYFRVDDGNGGWETEKDKERFSVELSVKPHAFTIDGPHEFAIHSDGIAANFTGYILSDLPDGVHPPFQIDLLNPVVPRRLKITSTCAVRYVNASSLLHQT